MCNTDGMQIAPMIMVVKKTILNFFINYHNDQAKIASFHGKDSFSRFLRKNQF